MNNEINKNPDILNCLANLSSDEVFTPPELANKMLDMLPQELFESKNTTFLDPCSKSGVFLREIAKRLIKGLEKEIPDLQERVNWIMSKQLYGVPLTDLTAKMTRRTLYCSRHASGKYSVVNSFDESKKFGNILSKSTNHSYGSDGKCTKCGASKELFKNSKEKHAYYFIHENNVKGMFNVKFDVIIGNPPYQLNVGNDGGNSAKAKAIYHKFVETATKLNPRYITMIIPSRWMTRSTEGISDEWIDSMINDKRIKVMHDFLDANQCFPGVEIKGGVCYFLWDSGYNDKCNYHIYNGDSCIKRFDYLNSNNTGIVIRDEKANSIIEKIINVEKNYLLDDDKNFSSLVSPKDFYTNKETLTSSWKGFASKENEIYNIKYYLNKNIHGVEYGYVKSQDISKNIETAKLNKVFIPAAGGTGNDSQVLGHPFYGEPNSVCSQTYLVIGYNLEKHNFTKEQCFNIISYVKTKFFRYLVSLKKKTQNGPRMVYQFVPIQDFNKSWSDNELYKKYNLSEDEIEYIESSIKTME